MDIKAYINTKKRLIDRALDIYLPSPNTKPREIHNAMRYAVFSGGKRIRPLMTIAAFEACGGKGASIMPVACAMELIHSYTLIHDDLPCMDDDDYRRGKLSCHKRFGENIALLAGDALLTLSFLLLSETGNINVIKEVSRAIGSLGTIGGQAVDIQKERVAKNRQELDYITTRKTGCLFEAAVKTAAILKRTSAKKINALGNFGRLIGFTFQLVDDVMDADGYVKYYGPEKVRKMAESLTKKAEAYLGIFGKKSRKLSEIAEMILNRQN